MIIETLVTTLNEDGSVHAVPMGPEVQGWDDNAVAEQGVGPAEGLAFEQFELRPFRPSRTLDNLLRERVAIVHVIDDALLLARCITGQAWCDDERNWRLPKKVAGRVYAGCCRWYEVELTYSDLAGGHSDGKRASLQCRTVAGGRQRDFLGINRALNAVVEAAILATRLDLIPAAVIRSEMERLAVAVRKTGSPREDEAFQMLHAFVAGNLHKS